MLTKLLKTQWLEALTSGKYKHGRNFLKSNSPKGGDQYCCLGVLADIIDPTA